MSIAKRHPRRRIKYATQALALTVAVFSWYALLKYDLGAAGFTILVPLSIGALRIWSKLRDGFKAFELRDVVDDSGAVGLLYLRTFASDQKPAWAYGKYLLADLQDVESDEQEWVDLFSAVGRAVVVSNPSLPINSLKADHIELNTEEWKECVSDLISRAQLIIIKVGASEGIRWEAETIMLTGKLYRTLWLFPSAYSATERDSILISSLPGSLIDAISRKSLPNFTYCWGMYIDSNNVLHTLEFRVQEWRSYLLGLIACSGRPFKTALIGPLIAHLNLEKPSVYRSRLGLLRAITIWGILILFVLHFYEDGYCHKYLPVIKFLGLC